MNIPGVSSDNDILNYLVPIHPTEPWKNRVAVYLERNDPHAGTFECRSNQYVIVKPYQINLEGKPLRGPLNLKTGINDLLYFNQLINENTRREEIIRLTTQEQAIMSIRNNLSRINNDDDDDQEPIPIVRMMHFNLSEPEVSTEKKPI